MKKILFIVLLFYHLATFAQWEQVSNGIWGGDIYALQELHGRLFAGTRTGGLYMSIDHGDTWSFVTNGLSGDDFGNVISNGQELYTAGSSGLYHSSDTGTSWSLLFPGLNFSGAIAVKGDTLFAVSGYNSIVRSINNGVSWQTVVSGNIGNYIWDLSFIGNNIVAATTNGLHLSSDLGISWTIQSNITSIADFAVYNGKLYAAGQNYVLVSIDQGITWTNIYNDSLIVGEFKCIEVNQYRIMVGTNGAGVMTSENQGLNWSFLNSGLDYKHVFSILDYGDYFVAGTRTGGVFITTFPYTSWINKSVGIVNYWTHTIGEIGNKLFVGKQTNTGNDPEIPLYRSQDNAATWQSCDSGLIEDQGFHINWLENMGPNIIAGSNEGAFISQDSGTSWQPRNNNGLSTGQAGCILNNSGQLLVTVWSIGVFASSDTGNTWLPYPQIIMPHPRRLVKYTDTLIAVGEKYYYSLNGGLSWYSPAGFSTVGGGTSLTKRANFVFVGTDNKGIYRSQDNGYTWTQVNIGLPSPIQLYINDLVTYNNDIYAATNKGVFVSHNNGATWINCSNNLINLTVTCLKIKNAYLYAGTFGASLWRMPLGPATGIPELNPFDKVIVFPNPANDIIHISYNGTETYTYYDIIDILGNIIQSGKIKLTDQPIIFIGNLPIGMYLIKFKNIGNWQGVKFVKVF